jgi:hypothetical protein
MLGEAFIILSLIYFMPTIIALSREHKEGLYIFLINLFIGWTFVGYLVALLWAIH